jgi:hypothetical protein
MQGIINALKIFLVNKKSWIFFQAVPNGIEHPAANDNYVNIIFFPAFPNMNHFDKSIKYP